MHHVKVKRHGHGKRFMDNCRLLLFLFVVCLYTGCGPASKLPDNPMVFEQKVADGYAYLTYEDKVYLPYCPCSADDLGNCIGYYDVPADEYSDASRTYVYEWKDYSSDEWLIDYDVVGKSGMILREANTTDVPEGLTSEYEWNQ